MVCAKMNGYYLLTGTKYDTILGMRCRCRFLVPTHYNDGRPVEPEKIVLIKKVLDRKFNGCRFSPPSEGTWHEQVEGMHEVEVAVVKKRVPELRSIVIAIAVTSGRRPCTSTRRRFHRWK